MFRRVGESLLGKFSRCQELTETGQQGSVLLRVGAGEGGQQSWL